MKVASMPFTHSEFMGNTAGGCEPWIGFMAFRNNLGLKFSVCIVCLCSPFIWIRAFMPPTGTISFVGLCGSKRKTTSKVLPCFINCGKKGWKIVPESKFIKLLVGGWWCPVISKKNLLSKLFNSPINYQLSI